MEKQLVVFQLSDEHYGVDIASVDSIIRLQPILAIPHAPAFVEGVTRMRGTVLPVVDLRKRFGLPPQEATKETRIVVAEIDHLVDLEIDDEKLRSAFHCGSVGACGTDETQSHRAIDLHQLGPWLQNVRH